MTTAALRRDDTFEGPAWLRGPQEGWLAVIAFIVMIGAVALSIDAAHWAGFVPEGPSETGFLLPVMLLAALWGFVSAKLGWPALAADVVGAAVGAGVLLLAVAGIVAPGAAPGPALTALSDSVYRFYHDLVIDGVRSSETSVFLLVLGAAMWTVAQLAAVNLFGRHRGLAVVAMTGVAIFIELSVSAQDQYGYLVVFAVAALVLLMRLNLLDQRVGWMRRGIGDQGAVATLYTRSGVTFIALTLIGALALTATASSAPLAGVLNQPAVRDQLVNLGEQLNTLVGGVVGNARGPNGLFATSSTITGLWESSPNVVFTATTDTQQGYYWRGATYDTFDGTTWKQVDRTNAGEVAAGAPVLAGTADGVPSLVARATVKTTIHDVNLGSSTLVAPEDVASVDQTTTVYTAGPGGGFDSAELTSGLGADDSYTVTSLVVPQGDEKGAPDRVAAGRRRDHLPRHGGAVPAVPGRRRRRDDQRRPVHRGRPAHVAAGPVPHRQGDPGLLPGPGQRLPLQDRRARRVPVRRHRGLLPRRVPPGRLLRVLRHVDGHDAAHPGHPGPLREGLPARPAAGRRQLPGPGQRRPRLGAGLLPGLRLDPLRSHAGRAGGPWPGGHAVRQGEPGAGHAHADDRARSRAAPMRRTRCAARCRR